MDNQSNNDKSVPPDPRSVMVIHGRDKNVREALFKFLRAINLNPLEFNELANNPGWGSSTVEDALRNGFSQESVQAYIVLVTPDDEVLLREALRPGNDEKWSHQARPNVYIEAGMAWAVYPERTIFLQCGDVRSATDFVDFDKRLWIKIAENDPSWRISLVAKLKNIGCSVKADDKKDWLNVGEFTPTDPVSVGEPSSSQRMRSHLIGLNFAQLLCNLFHSLDRGGIQDIKKSARIIFLEISKGNQKTMIMDCRENWRKSEEYRNEIENKIFNSFDDSTKEVDDAFVKLKIYVNPLMHHQINHSHNEFKKIKELLRTYKKQLNDVSTYFDPVDNLDDSKKIKMFVGSVIDLSLTIDRLIDKSGEIMKNLIESFNLEVKSRLSDRTKL